MSKENFLIVDTVAAGSPAHRLNIRKGDMIICINGNAIRDEIDFQYYSAESSLEVEWLREGKKYKNSVERDYGDLMGLTFLPQPCNACGNHCIFCFVDQNPTGLRDTLYFKDEDYRLSFLHGNYVTLTNAKKSDLERIVKQHLSPLYISVHAADKEVRKKMLGIKRDDQLIGKIDYLTENGIELHGQIVLCRGLNDQHILAETISVLSQYYPHFRSLAVVPVGLTKHRKDLTLLQGYDTSHAGLLLDQAEIFQKDFMSHFGEAFIYCADEFYLKAGRDLPESDHYAGYWQIENGVGMMRSFLDDFQTLRKKMPKKHYKKERCVLVTGQSAGPVLEKEIMPAIHKIRHLEVALCEICNDFFGPEVTVSGLLAGRDILGAVKELNYDRILLPSNCLNSDNRFLDDLPLSQFQIQINKPVTVADSLDQIWIKQ